MKATELIAKLQAIVDEHGDLPTFTHGNFCEVINYPEIDCIDLQLEKNLQKVILLCQGPVAYAQWRSHKRSLMEVK